MQWFMSPGRPPIAAITLSVSCVLSAPAATADSERCEKAHTADVERTDITLTTPFLASVHEGLGFESEVNFRTI